ncbi:MAG: hypothetical protein IJO28_05050 [Oscillospiraceae bacterium]|nr:hypothetical protein [Oscillospiraceae bacterium]
MGELYQVGEKVVYGIHGVCVIVDLEIKTLDRQKVQYYVLEPVDQPGARYYIPTQKPAAVAKLSPVLSREALNNMLANRTIPEGTWISDENQRKQKYRELISSTDRAAILAMVRALHIHKDQQAALGKKFHLCDEGFLRDAEKLLCSEFSMVLGISPQEIADYIKGASGR